MLFLFISFVQPNYTHIACRDEYKLKHIKMKVTIDTEESTIRIENSRVHLSELVQTLNSLFPDNSWMEYELIIGQEIILKEVDPYPFRYPEAPIKPYINTNPSPWTNPPNILCSYNATATNKQYENRI